MIHVHGYLGELSDDTRTLARTAALVVGGRRHLADLDVDPDRQVVLGALTPALERLATLRPDQDALVVASGGARRMHDVPTATDLIPTAADTALIFEGGGMRGSFSTGILTALLEAEVF